jgi:hypothetical protein
MAKIIRWVIVENNSYLIDCNNSEALFKTEERANEVRDVIQKVRMESNFKVVKLDINY